jgi:hypothetical protein
MYPVAIQAFKFQPSEPHQRKAVYRLLKSLDKSNPWSTNLITALGKMIFDLSYQIVDHV